MSSKNNYYKFAIQTSDGVQLSNVIEYHGLILGKITNTVRQANPQRQKCTEMFALMRYSDEAQPETLWQGEITNFDPGYNLEIFPHPESAGDYLVFTHPTSNKAHNHCYWLRTTDNSCIEIAAAQTKLNGLKYIHYHAGKFIGVFYAITNRRIHLAQRHAINVREISISFRGARNQLISNGKQINVDISDIRMILDHAWGVKMRICSYITPDQDSLVFQINVSEQVKYNILTQEYNRTVDDVDFLQADDTPLVNWDNNMPHSPLNQLRTYPIPDSPNFFVIDVWCENNIYIYKQSDKRFHLINTAPHWHLRLYNEIKFLTSKLAIIDKYNSRTCDYTYFLTELDTDKLTLKIIAESSVMHYQSIAIANTPIIGGIIYQDSVYEPTHQNAHKSCQSGKSSHTIREIDRVANIIASVSDIPHQLGCELIGKFTLLKSSHSYAVEKLDD
jgi:hypothetical protein